jgi:putative endonuclease
VPKQYYVYIMANPRQKIYTGVTSNLEQRVWQHKNKVISGFTSKYDCTALVYYEVTEDVRAAIEREKQIKGWLRKRKLALITLANPTWRDMSADWPAPSDVRGTAPDPSLRSG